jgi:hypothetical protein
MCDPVSFSIILISVISTINLTCIWYNHQSLIKEVEIHRAEVEIHRAEVEINRAKVEINRNTSE